MQAAKEALREAVQLPLQHPELFAKSALISACKGVLLFGPPGESRGRGSQDSGTTNQSTLVHKDFACMQWFVLP